MMTISPPQRSVCHGDGHHWTSTPAGGTGDVVCRLVVRRLRGRLTRPGSGLAGALVKVNLLQHEHRPTSIQSIGFFFFWKTEYLLGIR